MCEIRIPKLALKRSIVYCGYGYCRPIGVPLRELASAPMNRGKERKSWALPSTINPLTTANLTPLPSSHLNNPPAKKSKLTLLLLLLLLLLLPYHPSLQLTTNN